MRIAIAFGQLTLSHGKSSGGANERGAMKKIGKFYEGKRVATAGYVCNHEEGSWRGRRRIHHMDWSLGPEGATPLYLTESKQEVRDQGWYAGWPPVLSENWSSGGHRRKPSMDRTR